MEFIEKTINKNRIYDGKILAVRCDEVLLPNGRTSKREIVEYNGGSCVLAAREGKLLFVKQYRYAMGEVLYEIPAGKLEKGEDPKAAAVRESICTAATVSKREKSTSTRTNFSRANG